MMRLAQGMLMLALLISYCLPFTHHPVSSMNLNAYDLAEWLSLHPAEQTTSLPMLNALLLRLPLGLLCISSLVLAIQQQKLWRFSYLVLFCLLGLAQLPPPEAIQQLDNGNYRQQLLLAVSSVLLALLWAFNARRRLAWFGLLFMQAFVLCGVIVAVLEAQKYLAAFQLDVTLGVGVVGYSLVVIAELITLGRWLCTRSGDFHRPTFRLQTT